MYYTYMHSSSWEGHEELPELNVENAQVREHLFKVAKFWLGEVGVDGWRLDVAHELPPSFWRDFRTVCTEANPQHVLLGEGGRTYEYINVYINVHNRVIYVRIHIYTNIHTYIYVYI